MAEYSILFEKSLFAINIWQVWGQKTFLYKILKENFVRVKAEFSYAKAYDYLLKGQCYESFDLHVLLNELTMAPDIWQKYFRILFRFAGIFVYR